MGLAVLQVQSNWLAATLLVAVRLAAATALVPVFGTTRIPAPARVLAVLALSALLVLAIGVPPVMPTSLLGLTVAMAAEALVGAAFALGFAAAYGAADFAGRTLDTQIGFSAAAILNPATQALTPLLGSLMGLLVLAVFLSMDGHLLLLRALSLSLLTTPPGVFAGDFDWPALWRQSGLTFSFGLALAAPLMFLLMLSDIALAVLARSMPQLNVFMVGFAVKVVLGLMGLAYSVRFLEAVIERLFTRTFLYWQQLAL
jgi:flagellar biosynthetic protein FliR